MLAPTRVADTSQDVSGLLTVRPSDEVHRRHKSREANCKCPSPPLYFWHVSQRFEQRLHQHHVFGSAARSGGRACIKPTWLHRTEAFLPPLAAGGSPHKSLDKRSRLTSPGSDANVTRLAANHYSDWNTDSWGRRGCRKTHVPGPGLPCARQRTLPTFSPICRW